MLSNSEPDHVDTIKQPANQGVHPGIPSTLSILKVMGLYTPGDTFQKEKFKPL